MKIIKLKKVVEPWNRFKSIIIIFVDCEIYILKDGNYHNEIGPAIICKGIKRFFYKGYFYGHNDFTIKSWKRKVKELKRQERLEIFI